MFQTKGIFIKADLVSSLIVTARELDRALQAPTVERRATFSKVCSDYAREKSPGEDSTFL
jgi:hypothetical protein